MRRGLTIAGVVGATVAVLPASAYASDEIPASVFYPHIGVSLIGLAVAGTLLFQAVGVRKIALGGAIAEKISYVILAILCLAASAITEWAVNFTDGRLAGAGTTRPRGARHRRDGPAGRVLLQRPRRHERVPSHRDRQRLGDGRPR